MEISLVPDNKPVQFMKGKYRRLQWMSVWVDPELGDLLTLAHQFTIFTWPPLGIKVADGPWMEQYFMILVSPAILSLVMNIAILVSCEQVCMAYKI